MMLLPTEEEKKKQANAGGSTMADPSRYISQNQPGAQRLASSIGNNVVQAGNQARQANQNVQQNFSQQVQSSRVPYNEAVANRAAADPRSFYNYQRPEIPQSQERGTRGKQQNQQRGSGRFKNMMPMIAQNAQNAQTPAAVVSQEDIEAFNQMRQGNYAGPQDLTGIEGYGNLAAQEAAATDAAANTATDVGREDLLSSFTNKPVNPLDSMLLGTGPSLGILGDAAAQNKGIAGLSDLNNEKAISEALAAKQANMEGASKIDKMMFGPEGAFNTLKDRYSSIANQKGGGSKRQAREIQKQDYAQQLEALNRLMGTDYKLGNF